LGSFLIISLMLLSNALVVSSFIDEGPSYIPSRGPLDVIKIDSDQELIDTASDRNWTGNGSISDPFVITDLDIDAGGGHHCLWIANTSLSFKITNSTFSNATYEGIPTILSSGLILMNVTRVQVLNVICKDNINGITIIDSSNVTVLDSNFNNNTCGIKMELSEHCHVGSCSLTRNTQTSIHMYGGNSILVRSCAINNTINAIYALNVHDLWAFDNLIFDSSHGIRMIHCYGGVENNSILNLSKECIMIYHEGASDGFRIVGNDLSSSMNGIHIPGPNNGEYVIVDNQIIYGTYGLKGNSNNSQIGSNEFTGSEAVQSGLSCAIYFEHGGEMFGSNRIENNTVISERGDGFFLDGDLNRLFNNSISTPDGIGITISGDHNDIVDSTISSYGRYGIEVLGQFNRLIDNSIIMEKDVGIHLNGIYNELHENRLSNCSILMNSHIMRQTIDPTNLVNGLPVYYHYADSSSLEQVNISGEYGQILIKAPRVRIHNMTFSDQFNFLLVNSGDAIVENVTISGCIDGALICGDVRVKDSFFLGNKRSLIISWTKGGQSIVEGCEFTSKDGIGLTVFNPNVIIRSNEFKDHSIGVSSWNKNCLFTGNLFQENGVGISLSSWNDNRIERNHFLRNGIGISQGWEPPSYPSNSIEYNLFQESVSYAISYPFSTHIINNAFIDNNGVGENPEKRQVELGTDIKYNYWSDHNASHDLMTGIMEEAYLIEGLNGDMTPIAYIPREIVPSAEITSIWNEGESVRIDFTHPESIEHVIYRSYDGSHYDELARVPGDQGSYLDPTVLDLLDHHYMVRSITDLGPLFPSIRYTYFVDRITPELEITSPLDGDWLNGPAVKIHWEHSDNDVDNCKIFVSLDGDAPIDVGENRSIVLIGLSDGPHLVEVECRDRCQNSIRRTLNFNVDTTAPELKISSPVEGELISSNEIDITGLASDNLQVARIERRFNGEWMDLDELNHTLRLPVEGQQQLLIRVTDMVDNWVEKIVNFTVDRTIPYVVDVFPYTTMMDFNELYLWVRFSEEMDTESLLFTLNGDPIDLTSDQEGLYNLQMWTIIPGTSNYLTISGADLAGNRMSEFSKEFTRKLERFPVTFWIIEDRSGDRIVSTMNYSIDGAGLIDTVDNGTFSYLLPSGNYTIRVWGDGFKESMNEFNVSEGMDLYVEMERVEEDVDPVENEEEFPYFLIIMLAVTILLILFFYIVPAKLAAKQSQEE
ncbi:MAG: right-handed parallel beta-helix repeat-containing protein, partial [Thermoplasmata archaeon]|nr:right-handed parallel beta-helix repeat-containing protein [Thermoplasmata archaeon]